MCKECIDNRLRRLQEKYGEILSLAEIAEVFKYSSISAVRKAKNRETLPVKLYQFQNKTGFYAKVEDVATSIEFMQLS